MGSPRDLILCSKEPYILFGRRAAEIPFPDGDLINFRCWPDDYKTPSAENSIRFSLTFYRSEPEQRVRDEAIRLLQQQVIPGFEFPKVDKIPKIREGLYPIPHAPVRVGGALLYSSTTSPSTSPSLVISRSCTQAIRQPSEIFSTNWAWCARPFEIGTRRLSRRYFR